MRVALTGATSPLGRRVYQGLLDAGHQVLLLVRPEEEAAWQGPVPEAPILVSDLVTPERYGPQLRDVQALVHLAELSQAPDHALIDVNLKGTQSLLHAFGAWADAQLLLVLSSALVAQPYPEDMDAHARAHGSAWLATRVAAEARVNHWTRRTGVPTVVVRAGHPYGALGIDGPLSGWLDAAARSAESDGKLRIDGGDIPLPFVQVDDLAQAIVRRVGGTRMPGERTLVGQLSRVQAVGLVGSLGELHDLLCRRTERLAQRRAEGRGLRRLLATVPWTDGASESGLPSTPAFIRQASVTAADPEWEARFGKQWMQDVAEALVGGAC